MIKQERFSEETGPVRAAVSLFFEHGLGAVVQYELRVYTTFY
jgi:hypothetical protein